LDKDNDWYNSTSKMHHDTDTVTSADIVVKRQWRSPFFPGHESHVIQEDTTQIKCNVWSAGFCRPQCWSCHTV